MFPLSVSGAEISVNSKRLVGPINLMIKQKSISVVLGANGSGKTTLFRNLLYQSKKKNITPQDFNKILNLDTNLSDILIKNLILRSQSQAKYNNENFGHFGLGISHYTHFTSPEWCKSQRN